MDEIVCPVLQSYLIVTTRRPGIDGEYLALQVNAVLYSDADHDGVATLGKRNWGYADNYADIRQIAINRQLWLIQAVENPVSDTEWQEKVFNLLSLCAENRVHSLVFSPPSATLQGHWYSKGLTAIDQALRALTKSSLTVFVLCAQEQLPTVKVSLAGLGLILDPKVTVDESSLVVSLWKQLKCGVCNRLVYNPRVSAGSTQLYCKQCLLDRGLSEAAPGPEMELIKQLIAAIPVTCRCGHQTTASALDKHTLACESKEFYCLEHKQGFKSDEYFSHLMEAHFDFIRANAKSFLSRD